ncbi:hypothetical protein WA026_002995 [Henosepilachna vigintioctopunctata]|uniref:Complex 1 LYR protein domain-containing protein n=1 Tax=Henosepilachna vigintioctopunctata TaxID=420089 RepID=A0AAW1TID4_9CUCU
MSSTRIEVLNLYKYMLKEAKKIPAYNFRNYALRRIKDSFRENKNIDDPDLISSCIAEARKNLDILRRQVVIASMYSTEKLVIEHIQPKES